MLETLIKSILAEALLWLRERTIIATMTYSIARPSKTFGMGVKDIFPMNRHFWLRLHGKGGNVQSIPRHHNLKTWLRVYIVAAELEYDPLFQTLRALKANCAVQNV